MGRPRRTQESLGGHFEGTGLVTSLEVRAGPSTRVSRRTMAQGVRLYLLRRSRGRGAGLGWSGAECCLGRAGGGVAGTGVLVRAPEPRAEQGRSRGPGSRAGGTLAHSGFRRGCVLLRPPHRTEGGRGGAGGTRVSGFSRAAASGCVWAETSRAGASPALALPGFCPLGPLDCQSLVPTSQSGESSPVLTVVCLAAVLALHRRVSYGNLERNY